MKSKVLCGLMVISLFATFLSSCGKVDEDHTVVVDSEEAVISYSLVTAQIDDVILTQNIDCKYKQTNDQEVSFDVTGKFVDKVYVHEGDEVKKGDLLCELSSASLEEEIERLTYQIKRNELLLSYTEMDEALDIQDVWVSGFGDADTVKGIQDRYARQRVLLNDSLEFDREELAIKKKELAGSRLYAKMDGKVYKLKTNLEGSTTKEGTVIMTIVDNSNCLFTVEGIEYKDLFKEGQQVNMKVSYSSASGEYILIPYEMDKWDENMLFEVFTGPDNATPEVGTMGTINVPVESRSQVLSIPNDVLHIAGDKSYVYTLSADNNREIRYVEIGLKGDERVEILSGLSEGEKVVKK